MATTGEFHVAAVNWDAIEAELAKGGPVIIKVYAGSTPPEVERL